MLQKNQSYLAYLAQLEKENALPSGLLKTQMMAESAGNPAAMSPAGALGAFQFMPATAQEYGIDPYDPIQAAQAAAKMNRDMLNKYEGDMPKALAAYNWGQGNVDRKGLAQAPNETRSYVNKILSALNPISAAQASELAQNDKISLMLEAERRGILPDNKKELLAEARRRGLVGGNNFDQERIQARVEEEFNKLNKQRGGDNAPAPVGGLEALAYGVGQSIPGGDEAASALAALLEPIAATIGGREQRSRDEILTGMRAATDASAETNPAAYYTGMIAPTAISALASGGASVPSSLSKIAGGAGRQGALYGAAYGFGAGEGNLENRLKNSMAGAVTGAVAGKVLEPVINTGSSALSRVGKTFNRYRGKAPPLITKAEIPPATVSPNSLGMADELLPQSNFTPTATKPNGDLFTATAGQRTQNVDIQRLENSALAGTLTPKAQSAAQSVINKQNLEFNSFLNNLGRKNTDINASLDDISGVIKNNFKTAQGNVRSAYDLARQGTSVTIGKNEIKQGLWNNIAQYRRDGNFDLSKEAMPAATRVIKKLGGLSKGSQRTNVTGIKLGALENWRSIATSAANDSRIPSEQKFLRGVVRQYDDFMERTAAQAVDLGDTAAINAFRNAVKERKTMGQLFERNKLVESIARGEKDIADVAKDLVGTGSIRGMRAMKENLNAILKAAKDEAPLVKSDLQSVFANRIYEKAITSTPNPLNPNQNLISPLKLAGQLEEMFVKQRNFAETLYGKEATAQARQAIKELRLIGGRQPKVGSTSGSGEEIARFLTPIIRRIPVVGNLVVSNFEKGAIAKQSSSALEALSGTVPKDIVKQMVKNDFVPKAKFWYPSSEAAKAVSAQAMEVNPNE